MKAVADPSDLAEALGDVGVEGTSVGDVMAHRRVARDEQGEDRAEQDEHQRDPALPVTR